MARPTKSAAVRVGHQTREEMDKRLSNEQKLKSSGKNPVPPKQLTDAQKKIFRKVVKQLKEADILCSLDSEILAKYAISVDVLAQIDEQIQQDISLLGSSSFMASRKQYMSDFFRCTNELCLSPQSRAKMANMQMNAQKTDPLLEALRSAPNDISEANAASFDSVPDDLTIEIADEFTADDDE